MTIWAVIATRDSFDVEEVSNDYDAPEVVALYTTKPEAEQAVNRVILLREQMKEMHDPILTRERELRATLAPGSKAWGASLQHELAIRNKMLLAIHQIVKPRETTFAGDR